MVTIHIRVCPGDTLIRCGFRVLFLCFLLRLWKALEGFWRFRDGSATKFALKWPLIHKNQRVLFSSFRLELKEVHYVFPVHITQATELPCFMAGKKGKMANAKKEKNSHWQYVNGVKVDFGDLEESFPLMQSAFFVLRPPSSSFINNSKLTNVNVVIQIFNNFIITWKFSLHIFLLLYIFFLLEYCFRY